MARDTQLWITEFPEGLPGTQPEGSVGFASDHAIGEELPLIVSEASRYGLTEADVVRALLRPLLAPRRHCNCWSCRTRRGDLG